MSNIATAFAAITHDAVIWKANHIWTTAGDPDEQAAAMDQLTAMLLYIGNETKRNAYVKQICEVNKDAIKNKEAVTKLPEKDLRRSITDEQKRREKEAAAKKMQAEFNKTIQTAEDAGLPDDFKGGKQDIMDALKYGVYEHEKVYYSRGAKGDYPISNFTMRILYHVETSNEQAFRVIAVKNVYGFEVVIDMNTDDFVTVGQFKKVLARRGDFIFKGADSDLTRLQEFLQPKETKTTSIKTLGYNPRGNFWAWANGIMPLSSDAKFMPIDEYGIIPFDNKHLFIAACSKMHIDKDDQFENEKKFVYTNAPELNSIPINFQSWSELFYKAYGRKAIAGLLFYVGCLFRDIIMKDRQRYPLLNLFGPPGGGKGQMAESLMAMFGERQKPIGLEGASTVVGFMRKFAQFKNAITWLDEYKNTLPAKFIGSLKNLYDGTGYERGKMTNDFTTESTPVNSSCILSGQDMPTQDPALFMRVIMLAFQEGKFTDDQTNNFTVLKDLESSGLSCITGELINYRMIIQEHFKERFDFIYRENLKEVEHLEIDNRLTMNISIMLTVLTILERYLKFPFTYREAKSFLFENIKQQHSILKGNNDIAKFWEMVNHLFNQELIKEEKDFKLEDGYIFIRLQQVHPLYVKEMRQQGGLFLSKSTLDYYLKLDTNVFVSNIMKRFKDGSNAFTYKLKYAPLKIDLLRLKQEPNETIAQFKQRIANRNKEMGIDEPEINDDDTTPF